MCRSTYRLRLDHAELISGGAQGQTSHGAVDLIFLCRVPGGDVGWTSVGQGSLCAREPNPNVNGVGQECPTHTSQCPLLALSPMLNIERFARWPQPLSGQPES